MGFSLFIFHISLNCQRFYVIVANYKGILKRRKYILQKISLKIKCSWLCSESLDLTKSIWNYRAVINSLELLAITADCLVNRGKFDRSEKLFHED